MGEGMVNNIRGPKIWNNGRGWSDKYDLSNNAVQARERGELPTDAWKAMSKQELVEFLTSMRHCDEQEMRKLKKIPREQLLKFLSPTGYHHHKGESFDRGEKRVEVYTVEYSAFDWLEFYLY